MGKYWSEDAIDVNTRERIDKIVTGEYDEKIRDRVREKTIRLNDIRHFRIGWHAMLYTTVIRKLEK